MRKSPHSSFLHGNPNEYIHTYFPITQLYKNTIVSFRIDLQVYHQQRLEIARDKATLQTHKNLPVALQVAYPYNPVALVPGKTILNLHYIVTPHVTYVTCRV